MNGIDNFHLTKAILDKKELTELYVSAVLRVLAFSMIGIFVPLFLFKELGYSLNFIIYFYLIYALSFFVFTIVGARILNFIGVKHSMLLSMPIYVAYFGLLYLLETNPSLFFLVPFVYGMGEGIFWIAFHLDFSIFSNKSNRGKQISRFYTFALLAGLVGPIIGGSILTFSDFNLLFFIVSLLILGSAVPLLFSKDVKRRYNFSWKFFKVGSFKDFVSFVAVGGKGMTETIFWPIFIFSILKLYVVMGSLFTFLGVVGLITANVVGKLSDVFDKRKLIKWFSISSSLVWVVKLMVKTKLELIGVSFFSSVVTIGSNVPYTALTYNKSHKNVDYFIFRQLGLFVGRSLCLLLVLVTASLFSSFIFAAIASFGFMLL
jgi:MFS transporter, YQGE family, putative transporter